MSEPSGGQVFARNHLPSITVVRAFMASRGGEQVGAGPAGTMWRLQTRRIAIPESWEGDVGLAESVIRRIAAALELDAASLRERFTLELHDVLRLHIDGRRTRGGFVPLTAVSRVFQTTQRMIQSAGTSVISPFKVVRGGRYKSKARKLADSCYVGHSEDGSFVFPVYVPISEEHEQDMTGVAYEPFPRATSRTFAQGLSILSGVTEATVEAMGDDELVANTRLGVTREFCAAALDMITQSDLEEIGVRFQWADIFLSREGDDQVQPRLPTEVAFGPGSRRGLSALKERLSRPFTDPRQDYQGVILGIKENLAHTEYYIFLETYYENRIIDLRVSVTEAVFRTLFSEEGQGSTVVASGDIHLTGTGYEMPAPRNLKIFRQDRLVDVGTSQS